MKNLSVLASELAAKVPAMAKQEHSTNTDTIERALRTAYNQALADAMSTVAARANSAGQAVKAINSLKLT